MSEQDNSTIPTDHQNAATPGDSIAGKPEASPLGGPLGIVLSLVLLGTAGYLAYRTIYAAEPVELDPPPVVFICAETGKSFDYKFKPGDKYPVASPYSNKKTGYRAELCYWQKGSDEPKPKPTYVLLNEFVGKSGPTICPDCGRIVYPHNPQPAKGSEEMTSPESNSDDGPDSETQG